jgi:hypothetical protein
MAGKTTIEVNSASNGLSIGFEHLGSCVVRSPEVLGMLWTLFVILLVLWLLGIVSSYTLGGFIHLLLVLAVVVLIIQLITGRRAAL